MIYNALDISNYILYYYKHSKDYYISNLRLQRLLYYCQAKWLVDNNAPLFSDDILSWDNGPIVRNIYRRYKPYGSAIIPTDTITETDIIMINDNDRKILNRILDKCIEITSNDLKDITVANSAWKDCYQVHRENVIPHDKIKEFFKED